MLDCGKIKPRLILGHTWVTTSNIDLWMYIFIPTIHPTSGVCMVSLPIFLSCTFYLVRSCAKNKCLFYGRRKLITSRSTEIKHTWVKYFCRFQFMVDGLLHPALHFGGEIIPIALTKSASFGRKSTTFLWWLRVYPICFGCAVSSSESQRLRPQRKYYVMNAIHFIERVTIS